MVRTISRRRPRAFTLLEMLAAMAVLSVMMMLLLHITGTTANTWRSTKAKMNSFEQARSAFDRMTTTLSQADLNIYWGYDDSSKPTRYERSSELQFLSGPMNLLGHDAARHPSHGLFFQAPTGKVWDKTQFGDLPSVLNAYGYYIEYGDDSDEHPDFLPEGGVKVRHRFRLKEWRVPSEKLALYQHTSGKDEAGKPRRTQYLGEQSFGWITLDDPQAHTLAENLIVLVVSPRTSSGVNPGDEATALTTNYLYNSRTDDPASAQYHQLPLLVDLAMVAVDEESVLTKLDNSESPPNLVPADLFTRPENLDTDLAELGEILTERGIRYIVLRTMVRIAGAKGHQ